MMNSQRLKAKIKIFNETIWDNKATEDQIDAWLDNFDSEDDKYHALYLLSRFMYFGSVQMRGLLRVLYENLYRYPVIESIRKRNNDTLDESLIEQEFRGHVRNTVFFGIGNPSESGAHLLYFFRQENNLSKKLFSYTDEIIQIGESGAPNIKNRKDQDLNHFVFIDDFCGSGSQATSDSFVKRASLNIRKAKPDAKIDYLMLVGTDQGVNTVNNAKFQDEDGIGNISIFDNVDAVIKLDKTFKCFSNDSCYFNCHHECKNGGATYPNCNNLECREISEKLAAKNGLKLMKYVAEKDYSGMKNIDIDKIANRDKLGYRDCQLLLGFYHNTPNNSLPIIWCDEDEALWKPIFKRYNKKYNF